MDFIFLIYILYSEISDIEKDAIYYFCHFYFNYRRHPSLGTSLCCLYLKASCSRVKCVFITYIKKRDKGELYEVFR